MRLSTPLYTVQSTRYTRHNLPADALLVPLATYIVLGFGVGPVAHKQLTHGKVATSRGHYQGCVSKLHAVR
jgi:hypothetical protein